MNSMVVLYLQRQLACAVCAIAFVVWSGACACPSTPWNSPIPTPDEARASNVCAETAVSDLITRLQQATPEADAANEASAGRFDLKTLYDFTSHGLPALINRADSQVQCTPSLRHKNPQTQHELRLEEFFDWYRGERNQASRPTSGGAFKELSYESRQHCALIFRVLHQDYIARFNHALTEHQDYPHKDLCGFKTSEQARKDARKFSQQPPPELKPTKLSSVALAARFGDAEAVRAFIDSGAQLSASDDWGGTALVWSVIRGYPEVFRLLLNTPNGQQQDFCSALENAITYKRAEMALALIRPCSAQTGDSVANFKNAILNSAAESGDLELVRRLAEANFPLASEGVSLDKPKRISVSELSFLAHPLVKWDLLDGGSSEIVKSGVIAAHPLSMAAQHGHRNIIDFLLSFGLKATKETIFAAIDGNQGALLDHILHVTPSLATDGGMTSGEAMGRAVKRKALEAVRVLLRHGASLDVFDREGKPVLFEPVKREIGDALIDDQRLDFFEALLELGANPNLASRQGAPDKYRDWSLGLHRPKGQTPLIYAIWSRESPGDTDEYWFPAPLLHSPQQPPRRRRSTLRPVKALLAHGADVRRKDDSGLTALHYAARDDVNEEVIEVLLAKGADVNTLDNDGLTPLDHAITRKQHRTPLRLIRHGGKRGAEEPDNEGK